MRVGFAIALAALFVGTVGAENNAYGIVKGLNGNWAIVDCYNVSDQKQSCTEHWVIGAGSKDPSVGFGSDGDLFWRTDLQQFKVKSSGVWTTWSGGATWDGGAFTNPAEGPTGCTNPAFSFTADTNAGMCLSAADSVSIQTAASGASRSYGTFNAGGLSLNYVNGSSQLSSLSFLGTSFSLSLEAAAMFFLSSTDFSYGPSATGDTIGFTPPTNTSVAAGGRITASNLSASRTWTFPDATGDVAVTAAAGFPARTAAQTWAARSVAAGTGITVANGDGVSGNPTVNIDTATTPQFSSGTGLPGATCTVGQTYLETDVPRSCECTATNTWTCSSQVRTHATDCTALTDGLTNDLCLELDSERLFTCQPTAGGCDTAGEWILSGDGTGGGYATVDNEDTPLTQRTTLNFEGDGVDCADDTNQTTCTINTGGGGVPLPNTTRWFSCGPIGLDVNPYWGCYGTGDVYKECTWSITSVDASDGSMLYSTTAGTTDSTCTAWVGRIFRVGRNLRVQGYVKLGQTTNQRAFFGFTDTNTFASISASADVTDNRAMFRYDTSASDTNWKCVTNDNSGGGTITDSGVAAGTTSIEFEIDETPATNFIFKINGSTVCTHTTDLPASGTNLGFANQVRTLANETKVVQVGHNYFELDR